MSKIRYIVLLLQCSLFISISAQDSLFSIIPKTTNNAYLFGIGNSNLYDTYLSILKYKGSSFRFMNERMRNTTWFNTKFNKQQIIGVEFATTQNPAKNGNEYLLMCDYTLGGHYSIYKANNLKLGVGGLWNIGGGVIYNTRNSNNPASAKAYTNILASAIAIYNWNKIAFRWQVDLPVAGIMFSPKYGQSYYEISLGNSGQLINFASFHNQRALRNYITIDIPINKLTIRTGFLGSYYQTKINDIQTHNYSNSFIIGVVSESLNLSGSKIKKTSLKSSFYD